MTYKDLDELLQTLTEKEKNQELEIRTGKTYLNFSILFIEKERSKGNLYLASESYLVKEFKDGSSVQTIAERYDLPLKTVESYIRNGI